MRVIASGLHIFRPGEFEFGALPERGGQFNFSLIVCHDFFCDGKANSGTIFTRIFAGGLKGDENIFVEGWVNTRSIIHLLLASPDRKRGDRVSVPQSFPNRFSHSQLQKFDGPHRPDTWK
jgi:hypothetical protein